MEMKSKCRCGYAGPDEGHPCHGFAYTCKKSASHRFYNPELVALAGFQMKFQVTDTFACDECWVRFGQLAKGQHVS